MIIIYDYLEYPGVLGFWGFGVGCGVAVGVGSGVASGSEVT
jgi:hypothetical protein